MTVEFSALDFHACPAQVMRASLEVIETERATADESLLMVVGLPNAGGKPGETMDGSPSSSKRTPLYSGCTVLLLLWLASDPSLVRAAN